MKEYTDFIESKGFVFESSGFDIDKSDLNPSMFEFQKDIVRWALAKGKACIFADCGLGKTLMQLEWAKKVHEQTENGTVLILAPLAVCEQTQREGQKFGYSVNICESAGDVIPGINITNYDKLHKFDSSVFDGVVLDESSILKNFTGKMRNLILDSFCRTPYRLACTATPAPNDYMEFGNHAEFVGVMTRGEMLSMFFVHDGGQTSKWRLKKHATTQFFEWMSSWAVMLSNPADLGYDGADYILPPMNTWQDIVDSSKPISEILSLTERRQARKDSLEQRCQYAADLVNSSDDQWIVWCGLNAESERLALLINGSKEIKGADKDEYRINTMREFQSGDLKCLVTKTSITGYGMNLQNCCHMVFVGLSDSFEQYYQGVRRCYRFGQEKPVDVHIVISAKEGAVLENVEAKRKAAEMMQEEMLKYTREIMAEELRKTTKMTSVYTPKMIMMLPAWEEMRGV